jgi:hypothetical protein
MPASRSSIEAGKGHVTLATDKSALEKGLDEAKKKFQEFGSSIVKVGDGIAAAGAAITAPFFKGLAIFSEWGKEISSASRMTGIGFERIGELSYATGGNLDTLSTAIAKMNAMMEGANRGGRGAITTLRELGLTFEELEGMTVEERFTRIADALNNIADPGQRSALAVKAFGRGALELNLTGGASGLAGRGARGRELGAVMSAADVQLAKEFNLAKKELGVVTKGVWASIGAAAVPTMIDFFGLIKDGVVLVRKLVDENRPMLSMIFRFGYVMATAGAAIVSVSGAIFTLGKMFGFATSTVGSIVSILMFFVTNPIGIIILGIAAAVYTLYTQSAAARRWIDGLASSLASIGGDTIQGLSDALSAGDLGLAAQIGFAGIKLAWFELTDAIMGVWTTTVNWLASRLVESIAGWSLAWLGFKNLLQFGWSVIVAAFELGWNRFRTGAEIAYQAAQAALGGYDTAAAIESAAAVGRARERRILLQGATADQERQANLERERARIQADVEAQQRIINAPDQGAAAAARAERDRLRQQLADLNENAAWMAMMERESRVGPPEVGQPGAGFEGGKGRVSGTFSNALLEGFLGAHGETAAERNARLQLEAQLNGNRLIERVVDAVFRIRGVNFV